MIKVSTLLKQHIVSPEEQYNRHKAIYLGCMIGSYEYIQPAKNIILDKVAER